MKKTILLIITLLSFNFCFAQEEVNITYNQKKEVLLNGNKIDKKTNLETIKSILGTPVVYKEYLTGKVNYHYPDLGISVHFVNNNLLFIGANFNWDGDETFPKTTYTGKLEIDHFQFDQNSNSSVLPEIKIVEIKCILPGMCMTDPTKEKNNIIVGFKDEKVTQVGFEFR